MSFSNMRAVIFLQKAIRSMGDWTTAQQTCTSSDQTTNVDKWNAFEKEMRIERANKEMALKWSPPYQVLLPYSTKYQPAFHTKETSATEISRDAADSSQFYHSARNRQRMNRDYVEASRRIAAHNLPAVDEQNMVNPQKLFTPEKVPTTFKTENKPEKPAEEIVKAEPETSDQNKKVYTKLAVLTKSIDKDASLGPEREVRPKTTPSVLKIVTAQPQKTNPNKANVKPEEVRPQPQQQREEKPTPPVQTQQTRPEADESKSAAEPNAVARTEQMISPYPPYPYTVLPTPSGHVYYEQKVKKTKSADPPKWFQSPLTSIEKRLDIPYSHFIASRV